MESYLVNIKHSLNDEKLKDKITGQDRETATAKHAEVQQWLDSHPEAETSEYERQQKAVEDVFNPIMAKIYQ